MSITPEQQKQWNKISKDVENLKNVGNQNGIGCGTLIFTLFLFWLFFV